MLLALDSCFNACSVAVYDPAQQRVLASAHHTMARGQAEVLGPMVGEVLADAGLAPPRLTSVAVTHGPGTFTGLRIGLAYAEGLAMACGIPLLGIDSLTATAASFLGGSSRLAVVYHAGNSGLFYLAAWEGDRHTPPCLLDQRGVEAALAGTGWLVAGDAAEGVAAMLLGARVLPAATPRAGDFAAFAAGLSPAHHVARPLYLRAPDAKPQRQAVVTIRQAVGDDLPRLAALHAASFSSPWTVTSLADVLALPGAGALVATLAETIYGFVQFQWVAGEAEINTLCVLPEARRQGFGRDLLDGLEAHLRGLGTRRIFLDVAEGNGAARALYAAKGYVPNGLRRAYYQDGQDALLLVRDI
jgi:tRNA threonylcarbamoyl adenosine modification protein YeaZ/ribosomal-protein-alanine acetyltransferase